MCTVGSVFSLLSASGNYLCHIHACLASEFVCAQNRATTNQMELSRTVSSKWHITKADQVLSRSLDGTCSCDGDCQHASTCSQPFPAPPLYTYQSILKLTAVSDNYRFSSRYDPPLQHSSFHNHVTLRNPVKPPEHRVTQALC